MNLFAPDGRLLGAWTQWWFWVRTSVCFLLLCIPVITAPAAIVWLIGEQLRHRRGEAASGLAETVRLMRRSLLPALLLATCHLGAATLVMIGLLGPAPGPYGWVVLAVSTAFAVTWLLLTPWSWVILERNGSAREALRQAYATSLGRIELAVAPLVVIGGALALLPVLPTFALAFVLPALPAALATAMTYFCDRATRPTHHSQAGRTSFRSAITLRRKAFR